MYKLWTSRRGIIFDNLDDARRAALAYQIQTGIILAITEYKPRRRQEAAAR